LHRHVGPLPASLAIRAAQAEHDVAIAKALRIFTETVQPPLVGIMGDHGVRRDEPAYKAVAYLASDLARECSLLVQPVAPV
jgi:hypothetical protein